MNTIQLSKDEQIEFQALSERVDGFTEGARALAEHLKQRKLEQILLARTTAKAKESPDGTE